MDEGNTERLRLAPVLQPALQDCMEREKNLERRIEEMEATVKQFSSLAQITCDEQPKELMYPLSKVGFLRGSLKPKNSEPGRDVLVPFGQDVFVWLSYSKASEIYRRRLEDLRETHRKTLEREKYNLLLLHGQINALTGVPACSFLPEQVNPDEELPHPSQTDKQPYFVQKPDGTYDIQEVEPAQGEVASAPLKHIEPKKRTTNANAANMDTWDNIERVFNYYESLEESAEQEPVAEEKQLSSSSHDEMVSSTASGHASPARETNNSRSTTTGFCTTSESTTAENQGPAIHDTVIERQPYQRNEPSTSPENNSSKPVSRFKQRLRQGQW